MFDNLRALLIRFCSYIAKREENGDDDEKETVENTSKNKSTYRYKSKVVKSSDNNNTKSKVNYFDLLSKTLPSDIRTNNVKTNDKPIKRLNSGKIGKAIIIRNDYQKSDANYNKQNDNDDEDLNDGIYDDNFSLNSKNILEVIYKKNFCIY